MITYAPVAGVTFQYDRNINYWIKFYEQNTTTPISMSIDTIGSTLLAKAQINNTGFPTTDGTTVFIPHLAENYDAFIFPTEAEADANDTANATRVAENINPFNDDFSVTKHAVTVVDDQTVYPLTFNVSNEGIVFVDGRMLFQSAGAYSFNAGGDLVLAETLFAGQVMEVWSRAVAPPKAPVATSSVELSFIADIAATDLTNTNNFKTNNFDVQGDNGGASWSFTGNTVPTKAGGLPELATGNVYDINGREFIYSKTILFDRAFGVKSSDQSNNIHIDATATLNDMIAFGKLRGPADIAVNKGGSNLFFTPRQELEKTGTLDLINYELPIDFNNTDVYQQDALTDVINWEANGAGFKNLKIRYATSVTNEDQFNNKKAHVRISGEQPIEINSESVFSKLENIWMFGGWDGVKLDSQAPFGGLFWQFIMSQLYVTGQMNRAYSFTSISQVATTSTMQNCHASCKTRDGVTHLGASYLALQHMETTGSIEPGVTAGWESSWELESIFQPARPAWASGVFYRTFGTGYLVNNVQTMKVIECSLDGAHNEVDGNVMNTLNSVIEVSGFHLEGHNLSKSDGISFLIGSDCDFGFLYMFDLRLRPGAGNRAYLFGGVLNRNRNFKLEGVRNQAQAAASTGVLKYINGGNDITAFNAISCGSGVPAHLTFNMPDETHYDRPIKLVVITGTGTVGDQTYDKGIKTVVVASASDPEYTAQREDSGSFLTSGATGVLAITMDRLVTPIGDTVRIVNKASGTTSLLANGTGTIDGPTVAASDKVLTVTRITDTIFLSEVSA